MDRHPGTFLDHQQLVLRPVHDVDVLVDDVTIHILLPRDAAHPAAIRHVGRKALQEILAWHTRLVHADHHDGPFLYARLLHQRAHLVYQLIDLLGHELHLQELVDQFLAHAPGFSAIVALLADVSHVIGVELAHPGEAPERLLAGRCRILVVRASVTVLCIAVAVGHAIDDGYLVIRIRIDEA